ncbi:MAG: hypothetical protein ACP5EP_09570, partial [Acidobacteriaceae bacterium]
MKENLEFFTSLRRIWPLKRIKRSFTEELLENLRHPEAKSPMASFSIPLTGLEADSTQLNTIANNLSN